MKIVVCVKHVPSGRLRIDPASKRLDRTGVGELNKVDKNAVEEAIRIKEGHGGEVVALTMGIKAATETLRSALGMGADRAVHVCDDALAGADLIATSRVLAAAIRAEAPDLVVFGQSASDGGGSVLWAAVAERLALPFVSQAAQLSADGAAVRVTRQTEFGDEVVEVALPAVVSVSDSINEPRYTSLKGQMAAKKKPLDTRDAAALGLAADDVGAAGSLTTVLDVAPPPARAGQRKIEDDGGSAAQAIVDYLAEKQLV